MIWKERLVQCKWHYTQSYHISILLPIINMSNYGKFGIFSRENTYNHFTYVPTCLFLVRDEVSRQPSRHIKWIEGLRWLQLPNSLHEFDFHHDWKRKFTPYYCILVYFVIKGGLLCNEIHFNYLPFEPASLISRPCLLFLVLYDLPFWEYGFSELSDILDARLESLKLEYIIIKVSRTSLIIMSKFEYFE